MKKSGESRVNVTVRLPETLLNRIKLLAEKHNIPLNELICIWLEAQADEKYTELLGKAHS